MIISEFIFFFGGHSEELSESVYERGVLEVFDSVGSEGSISSFFLEEMGTRYMRMKCRYAPKPLSLAYH